MCGDYGEALKKVIAEMGEDAFNKRAEELRAKIPRRSLPEFRIYHPRFGWE
jgi:hypothetical protein